MFAFSALVQDSECAWFFIAHRLTLSTISGVIVASKQIEIRYELFCISRNNDSFLLQCVLPKTVSFPTNLFVWNFSTFTYSPFVARRKVSHDLATNFTFQ